RGQKATECVCLHTTLSYEFVNFIKEDYGMIELSQSAKNRISRSLHVRKALSDEIASVNFDISPTNSTCNCLGQGCFAGSGRPKEDSGPGKIFVNGLHIGISSVETWSEPGWIDKHAPETVGEILRKFVPCSEAFVEDILSLLP